MVIIHLLCQKPTAAPRATHFAHVLLSNYLILGRINETEINILKNWGPQLHFGPSECTYGLNQIVVIIHQLRQKPSAVPRATHFAHVLLPKYTIGIHVYTIVDQSMKRNMIMQRFIFAAGRLNIFLWSKSLVSSFILIQQGNNDKSFLFR